ncbi:unnamed protein product [Phaedon cochleariae]|uniref:Uncharacterized protein n=1 Tax=Phaedon cochleariae TaxID=80249 RepID=A0A9P0DA27_PHACE|nr:unnamed protein product [Phaedon cochleariae]
MATTARRRDPDDDIAAIAKQISDQAEAIYQNWKARGLGPADLITCHAAGDTSKLGSMLKPQQPPSKPASLDILAQAPTMDNNRLEKLVKNFVDEDKARCAAAKGRLTPTASPANKSLPSSIQYALQKFEVGGYARPTATLPARKVAGGGAYGVGAAVGSGEVVGTNSYASMNAVQRNSRMREEVNESVKQHQQSKPTIGQKPQISPKPRISDTIEMTLPVDIATGLQTWPLKNRVVTTDAVKKGGGDKRSGQSAARPVSSGVTIDEVALEEKRLLHALKNGEAVREGGAGGRNLNSHAHHPVAKQPLPIDTVDHAPAPHPDSVSAFSQAATKWGVRGNTARRPVEQQVPHPELTTTQRQHLRQNAASSSANPVRPFLTRGSVAERVLIFERRPSAELLVEKRGRGVAGGGGGAGQRHQVGGAQILPKQPVPHTTLQRHVRAHRNVNIPRFHFPSGKPVPPGQSDVIKTKVAAAFSKIGERASREHFGALTQACQLPLYWKTPLYLAACADKGSCTQDQFMTFWQGMSAQCHDSAARFVYILTRGRRVWLAPEDFIPLVQDVVETHPGLTFLKEATEFHSRYVHTVIARIYYCVNRSWSGKVTIPELRRSNLLAIIQLLEEEEDINQITQFFSYEHFYVIYCKFWELDKDHDLFIDKQDLTRHNDHALSTRIIDRIFSGCVTRGHKKHQDEKMSYTDFVWFLLSEEDKLHPTAVEYWFRCMDLDGDGFLSMYELEYFYEEQMHRMEAIGIETLPFQDCLCQMLDMVKPKTPGKVSLSDLKRCKMTAIFYDTFFNLEKYLDHEQRDPFASQRDHDLDGQEMSDWDRYAAEEYELLVAEEGGNDQQDSLSFDEGNEEDLLSQHLDGALDDEDDPAELTDDSDECSI